MPISAWDTKVSMSPSLLLAKTRNLSCIFFIFVLSNFSNIPIVKEKTKVKLVPVIPTGAPKTLTGKIIQIPPLATERTIKVSSI